MEARSENGEAVSALLFVAGLALVPAALVATPEWIDSRVIQPARVALHSLGLAAGEADPGFMAMIQRTTWVRIPAMFVGAVCVFYNLSLFRSHGPRRPEDDDRFR